MGPALRATCISGTEGDGENRRNNSRPRPCPWQNACAGPNWPRKNVSSSTLTGHNESSSQCNMRIGRKHLNHAREEKLQRNRRAANPRHAGPKHTK
eukprot:977717-Lingulodinium_polyedra.AAC.1